MSLRALSAVFLLCACIKAISFDPVDLRAQSFDPYARILDPLAVARIGGDDDARFYHESFVGGGDALEPDGSRVLVSMTGTGVIGHIWVTYPDESFDTTAIMKIFIDDTLIYEGVISEFFLKPHGRMRAPLIREESGGLVCDLPITYKRNFKITYKGIYTFFAICWRDVDEQLNVPSFRPWDTVGLAAQVEAEAVFARSLISMPANSNEQIETQVTLEPGETRVILGDRKGGVIQKLAFNPANFQAELYRNLWLRCYWNDDQRAAIDVPLGDFFGAGFEMSEVNALQLKSGKDIGFVSYLPMPYRASARVELVNRSESTISLSASCSILRKVDTSLGELHCQFNETPIPRVFHLLPVLHAKGKGTVLGVMFNMPKDANPFFLEGDPMMKVDSSWDHYLRYPGTEDYFNGGWYFRGGPFSGPFAGCPTRWSTLYRFHYLDKLNFNQSVDWEWQHGANSDFNAQYRTVAYYYLEPMRFSISQDSLVQGKPLTLSGAGYGGGQQIDVNIDGEITSITADNNGSFQHAIATEALTVGNHSLHLNSRRYPAGLTILAQPTIDFVVDSQRRTFNILDSIEVQLRGFEPRSVAQISLGERVIGQNVRLDEYGCVTTYCKVGLIDSGKYELTARSEKMLATAQRPIQVTRTLRYEVEDLLPAVSADAFYESSYLGWWAENLWGNMRIAFIQPSGPQMGVTFAFSVPFTDDYSCAIDATAGLRYANMRVIIDGESVGVVKGFLQDAFDRPKNLPGNVMKDVFLKKGSHTIRFEADSRDPAATEWALGPDALLLTPLGNAINEVDQDSSKQLTIEVGYGIDNEPRFSLHLGEIESIEGELLLYDVLGRRTTSIFNGTLSRSLTGVIPTRNLAPGYYFLVFQSSDGPSVSAPVIIPAKQ